MADYEIYLVSSLEKVFPACRPEPMAPGQRISVWGGTRAAVQLVYFAPLGGQQSDHLPSLDVKVSGGPSDCCMRKVELVPSDYPSYARARVDDNYLTHAPGLFPDLLMPMDTPRITPIPGQYRSLWLCWDVPSSAKPGDYEISVEVEAPEQRVHLSFVMGLGAAQLPAQTLIHTEWFHADCLASYYRVEPLSEAHWQIIDRFIAFAVDHGINMLLTPVFTPPLDTAVGGERPTVQLVGVRLERGSYHFDFSLLSRWVGLCKQHGISYIEIPPLFTQWGARATPKIVADVDGTHKQLFGWDVAADSREYRAFLEAFLPAVRAHLASEGYDREHVYFHISDEPGERHMEAYRLARQQAQDLLADCPVIDALSSLAFYQSGLAGQPIPAVNHVQAFWEAKVPDLWTYYCCDQSIDVPNRFFSMPSARNRIMGVLMYLYDIKGFLHWGFNFYYTQHSRGMVDPYRVSHAGYAFPSGDPFLVYPGEGGQPLSSIRAEVQDEALVDLRALRHLESLMGRAAVEALIVEAAGGTRPSFVSYPQHADFLLLLREAVASAMENSRIF